jgi:hypothetical protein
MLASDERRATVALISTLVEFDARRLYLREGCSSLFSYCTQVLHLSEHAAYGRIEAARAARRFPVLLGLLADGALTLTAIGLLAPHLSVENLEHVLAAARHKTKRDVELLVATLRPKAAVPAIARKLPDAKPAAAMLERAAGQNLLASPDEASRNAASIGVPLVQRPSHRAVVAPLAPERYKLQITLSAETHATLRRAQDLLRHSIPNGDLAAVVERALKILVRELERTKFAATDQPRPTPASRSRSRYIPADVRRRVWRRDEGQCAFVGTQGRCTEHGFLEFHHVVPYADGGDCVFENLERLGNQTRITGWRRLGRDVLLEFREATSESSDQLIAPKAEVKVHIAAPGPNAGHFASHVAHSVLETVASICAFALGRSVQLPPTVFPAKPEALAELFERRTNIDVRFVPITWTRSSFPAGVGCSDL